MIEVYKTTEEGLRQIHEFEKESWVNITEPTKEELDRINKELHIPYDFLTDPLDVEERARTEVENKVILVVIRIPIYDEQDAEIPFTTLPLGIIFAKDLFVTICSKKLDVITDFTKGSIRNFSTKNKNRFMLQIFLRFALTYHRYLKEINKRTNATENELHKAMKNEELIKLLNIEKSLVFFTTSLKSDELMMERLNKLECIKFSAEEKDLLDDVTIEYKQAIEMANVYSNILSGMMDAFASVISNNLNVVLKFLTSVTIILMIPTLVASIYGMNLELPFQHSTNAFLIIMILSFVFSVLGVIIFWIRKWF